MQSYSMFKFPQVVFPFFFSKDISACVSHYQRRHVIPTISPFHGWGMSYAIQICQI